LEIIIDHLKGTKHPRLEFIYPLDYGYLKDTTSSDGGGIDCGAGTFLNRFAIPTFARLTYLKRILKSKY